MKYRLFTLLTAILLLTSCNTEDDVMEIFIWQNLEVDLYFYRKFTHAIQLLEQRPRIRTKFQCIEAI